MKLKAEFDLQTVFEIIEEHLKSIGYEVDLDEDMEAEGVEAEGFKIFASVLPLNGGGSPVAGKPKRKSANLTPEQIATKVAKMNEGKKRKQEEKQQSEPEVVAATEAPFYG